MKSPIAAALCGAAVLALSATAPAIAQNYSTTALTAPKAGIAPAQGASIRRADAALEAQ